MPLSNNKMLIQGSVMLLTLSTIDAIITLWGLSTGQIEEANPIMRWLIVQSPMAFITIKMALPVILCFLVWWSRNRLSRVIVYLLGVTLVAYAVTMGFHAWSITVAYLMN